MQTPDHRSGAYYVTARTETGQTMLALGPFKRHRRALGLVTMFRLAVMDAGLDPWGAYAYGTARAPISSTLVDGCLNAAFSVASDLRQPLRPAQRIAPAILERLAQSR